MTRRLCALGLLLASLTTISACRTKQVYPGERLPTSQVATVYSYHGIGDVSADIVGIDGKWAGLSNGSFELLPGRHEFEVSCMFGDDDDECPSGLVSADLKGGRHYQILPRRQQTRSGWFVNDECDLAVVEVDGPPPPTLLFKF